MAILRDYLDIAEAAHTPEGGDNVAVRWQLRKTENATWIGNGFQGKVYESEDEVIVSFSGTKGGLLTAPISQNSANLRIGAFMIPNMAGAAKKLVRWAEQNCSGKPVSIVGHSLGGALAQIVGAWTGRPFVSLNGPGMAAHLEASHFNILKPRQMARSRRTRGRGEPVGLCLNVMGDAVASYGKGHLGEVMPLEPGTGMPRRKTQVLRDALRLRNRGGGVPSTWQSGHSIDAIRDALPADQLNKDISYLSAFWPVKPVADAAPQLSLPGNSGPSLQERIAQHMAPGPRARGPVPASGQQRVLQHREDPRIEWIRQLTGIGAMPERHPAGGNY